MEQTINAIIVDDETKSCDVLSKMLLQYCPDVNQLGVANSLHEAGILIEEKRPDLIFLDIQLPDGNGFNLLKQIDTTDIKVIFTTAYEEYALRAIRHSAVDYLLKPINIDELIDAVWKCKKQSSTPSGDAMRKPLLQKKEKLKTIGLSTVNEVIFVAIENIVRLEAASNYTHFFMDNGDKVTVSHTLKHYEDVLPADTFMRVHQSHIINLLKVKKYIKGRGGYVIMNDGENIDISPRHKDDLLKALNYI